jgi:hypothetical protein
MAEHRRFFGLLCAHQWEVAEQSAIQRSRNNETVGMIYVLRCKHCGDVAQREVRV